MKEKSEVFTKFKEFELLVTNYTGVNIGTLQSVDGRDYISNSRTNLELRYSPTTYS